MSQWTTLPVGNRIGKSFLNLKPLRCSVERSETSGFVSARRLERIFFVATGLVGVGYGRFVIVGTRISFAQRRRTRWSPGRPPGPRPGPPQVGIAHLGAAPGGDVLLTGHDVGFEIAQKLLQVVVQAGFAEVLGGGYVVGLAFGRARQAEAALGFLKYWRWRRNWSSLI